MGGGRRGMVRSPIAKLREIKSYSEELGLDLKKPEDRQSWFFASVLFAKRISSSIALRTFKMFQEEGMTTPKAMLDAGWHKLVQVLDAGGYVRYDFSTASTLLDISRTILYKHWDLESINAKARSPSELEAMLMEFRGVGPVAVNIFLRELRGTWAMAAPKPSRFSIEVAQRLRVKRVDDVESQLVRIRLEYCKRKACGICPVNAYCTRRMR